MSRVGCLLGWVFATKSCTPLPGAAEFCGKEFNDAAAGSATFFGWMAGCAYEAIYEDNAVAALALGGLSLLVLIIVVAS